MNKSVLEINRYLPRFSLQERSLIKIMTVLCNNPQMLRLILRCDFKENVIFRLRVKNDEEWKAVLKMANELVSQVCSSAFIRKKLLELLWPVSHRIMRWKSVYAPTIANRFLQCFYWTDRCRIDTTRTARHIVGNRSIPVRKRFVLASSAALIEEMNEMWNEMSNADRVFFVTENTEKTSPLTLFWARVFAELYDHIKEIVDNAFEFAAGNGLLEAVKYILSLYRGYEAYNIASVHVHRLDMKLIEENHLAEDANDMAYFLFFEMDNNRQEVVFNVYTELVLSLLLHVSNYELCFSLLEERLPSESEQYFRLYLSIIFFHYHLELANDEGGRILFADVWQMIPSSMKNSIIWPDLRAGFPVILIRDHFPFLLERKAFKIMKFQNLDLISFHCISSMDFHEGKFQLLLFFIQEEVTTITWLTKYRNEILDLMDERFRHKGTWIRILRFVRYVHGKKEFPTKIE